MNESMIEGERYVTALFFLFSVSHRGPKREHLSVLYILARTATVIRRGIGLTTGFIGSQVSHTLTTESLTITTDSQN
jgi:hypothetical protein